MIENQLEKRTRGRPVSETLQEIPSMLMEALVNARFFDPSASRSERWTSLPDASVYDRKYRIRAAVALLLKRFSNTNAVGDLLGRSWIQVKRYLASGEVPHEVIEALAAAADVPLEWLRTGNPVAGRETLRSLERAGRPGEAAQSLEYQGILKLRRDEGAVLQDFGVPHENPEHTIEAEVPSSAYGRLVWIPHYDVRAAAGTGALVEAEHLVGRVPFHELVLRGIRANLKDLVLIEVKGDSMEPTLVDGEPILVDRSVRHVRTDSIYVLRIDAELLVKRLQRRLNGPISLISDNPRYVTQHLTPQEMAGVEIVGEVVWPPRR
ncbi:S24 family peptidase [Microvirga terricola]|uniref:LexA family transcriptional regulator n=1 Tax=Microvirga terricola TaxID=2719797 RepID=A0ABX0V6G2_9HYPH|nr:LexA family transcriptional regulator [Microvirga terricola]NIX75422.1 LexA family transcriptional regulator [Microvirga terricola]